MRRLFVGVGASVVLAMLGTPTGALAAGPPAQSSGLPAGSTIVSSKVITLDPLQCASHHEAANCKATVTIGYLDRTTATQTTATQAYASAWMYRQWWWAECGIGCVWKESLVANVVYNGWNIYNQTNNGPGCTPSGFGTSTTYCGYWYNGGNPYGYIDYIADFNVCAAFHSIGCVGHGIRMNINKNGTWNNNSFQF